MPENRILLYLEGKSDDADRAIDRLTARLRRFGKLTTRARIEVEDKRARTQLKRLEETLQAFGATTVDANAEVNTASARAALRTLAKELTELGKRRPSAEVQLRTGNIYTKIAALQARLRLLDNEDIHIDVTMRKQIYGEILALKAALSSLDAPLRISSKRSNIFNNSLNALGQGAAYTGQSLGGLGRSMSKVRLSLGALTVGLNPLVLGLLGTAGVIATSFVTSLLSIVASAGQATVALGALAIGGFGAILAVVPLVIGAMSKFKEQADIAGTSANALKVSARAMGESFRAATSQGAANAMRGLADALKALRPLVESLRPAFTSLGTDLARAMRLAGNDVAALGPKISLMVTRSGPLFRNLARAVGPLLETLLNIANVALPYLTAAMGRLVNTFKGWAKGTSDAKKLDETIGGLVNHMRIWGDLIGSLGGLLKAFFSAIAPLGGRLVKDLTAAADKTAAWLRTAQGTARVREQFSKLAELTKQVASGLGTMVTGIVRLSAAGAPAVQGLLNLFSEVGKILIATFGPAVQKLAELFGKLKEAIAPALPFFTNIVGPVISGVLQGVILALEPLIWLLGKFAELLGWVGTAAEPLKPIFEGLGKVLGLIFAGPLLKGASVVLKGIGSGFALIGRAAEGAGKILSWVGGKIGDLLSGPLKGLKAVGGAIGTKFTQFKGVTGKAWGGIKNFIGDAARGAQTIATGAFNGLKSKASSGWNTLKATASNVWNSGIANTIKNAAGKAKDGAVKHFQFMRGEAVTAFKGVKDGAARVFGGLKDFVVSKVSAAGRAIGNLASGFYNMGMDLIRGLIRGVKAMAGNVVSAVKNVVTGAKNAAKRLLGIGSPSKVFEGLGRDVGQGFANGISAMGGTVDGALRKTMGTGIDQLSAGLGTKLSTGVRPDLSKAVSMTSQGDTNLTIHHNGQGQDDERLARKVLWGLDELRLGMIA